MFSVFEFQLFLLVIIWFVLQPIALQIASGVANVKLGMVVMRSLSVGSSIASQIHSDPLVMILPDLSVCADSGCGFNVTMQTVDNTTYIDGASTVKSFTTMCNGTAYHRTYQCANGLTVTNICRGKPGPVTSTCPYLLTKPTCGILSSSMVTNNVCTMVSYTNTETTCQCAVPNTDFSARRLQSVTSRRLAGNAAPVGGTLVLATITNSQTISPPTSSPTAAPIVVASNGRYLSKTYVIVTVLVTVFGMLGFLLGVFCYCNSTKRTPWFDVWTTRRSRSSRSGVDSDNFNGLDEDLELEVPVIPSSGPSNKYNATTDAVRERVVKPDDRMMVRPSVIMDYPMFADDDEAIQGSLMMNSKGEHRNHMSTKRSQSPTLSPPRDQLSLKPGPDRSSSPLRLAHDRTIKPISTLIMPKGDHSNRLVPIVSSKTKLKNDEPSLIGSPLVLSARARTPPSILTSPKGKSARLSPDELGTLDSSGLDSPCLGSFFKEENEGK